MNKERDMYILPHCAQEWSELGNSRRRELPNPLPAAESEINGCQTHLMQKAFCRFGFSGLSQGAHPDRLSLREKILQSLEVSV